MDQQPSPHTFALGDLVIIEQERKDFHSSSNHPNNIPIYRIIAHHSQYKSFQLVDMQTGEVLKHSCRSDPPNEPTSSSELNNNFNNNNNESPTPGTLLTPKPYDGTVYAPGLNPIHNVTIQRPIDAAGVMELVTIEEHCRDFRAGKRTDIPLYRIARKEGLCDFFELKDVNTGDVRKGWCEAGELRMVEGMGDGEEVGRKGWEGKMMVESGGGSNEDDGAASGMC